MVDQEEQGDLPLPPGFRFHPTDEEVVTSYLVPKSLNPTSFNPRAIAVVNLNRCEPWDLPSKAKMGEKDQWYFFCQKDMKYPTGTRTNRATEKGYWKATGKDREIFKPGASPGDGGGRRDDQLIGTKKTLVFYTGRAPRGTKTNWVMHEFRLEGAHRNHPNLRLSPKDEWVVCKVFHKSNGEEDKKAAAAAVEDFAAGTPTVSSISVDATGAVDGGDEFLDSMFFDPYFDYSTGTFPADNHAATMMNDVGGFFGPPYDAFDDDRTSRNPLHQAAAVSSATVPLVPPSSSGSYRSSWNTVPSHYATGSSSYNLHDQAMMARALGGAGFPNFAGGGGFPSYSVPGISQQNSLRRRGYATGRLASSAAAAAANITGQAAKNLGP